MSIISTFKRLNLMNKKSFLIIALGGLLLACEPPEPPIPPEPNDIEILEGMKEQLLLLDDEVTSQTYQISQEDYYGISIPVTQSGNLKLYDDFFIRGTFTQSIDTISLSGIEERGIKDDMVYQIMVFGDEGYKNKYVDDSNARTSLLALDFISPYVSNVLDYAISLLEDEPSNLALTTNFGEVNLEEDGEHTLEFKIIQYAANGIDEEYRFERNDTLLVEGGKITASAGEMLESIVGGTNYKYQTYEYIYTYGEEIVSYPGTPLDPDNYPDFPN